MLGLGIYMNYKYDWDHAVPQVAPIAAWFPILCIFTFTITCTVGFLVVPWVMIGELYPQKVRGIVGGMTTCMAHTFVFIVVKTYPFLKSVLEMHGTFILYGCISFLGEFYPFFFAFQTYLFLICYVYYTGTIFFYYFLPETKGKTLQEIEDYFSGRTKSLQTKKVKNFDTNLTAQKDKGLILEKDKLLST